MVKQRQRRLYKSCVGVSAFILLALFGFGAGPVSAITLEGSGSSYARFPRWHQAFENVLSVELRTKKPNALLIYIDDSGLGNFYEISIFEGKIRLQFRLGARQLKNNATATQLALNGTTAKLLQIEDVQVDDGQWHRVVLYHFWETVKLQVDQSVVFSKVLDQQDFVFADYEQSSDVYVGGLPVAMQASSLSFPFAKALPRFEGSIRNLIYRTVPHGITAPSILQADGIRESDNDYCTTTTTSYCSGHGICYSSDTGPMCNCNLGRYGDTCLSDGCGQCDQGVSAVVFGRSGHFCQLAQQLGFDQSLDGRQRRSTGGFQIPHQRTVRSAAPLRAGRAASLGLVGRGNFRRPLVLCDRPRQRHVALAGQRSAGSRRSLALGQHDQTLAKWANLRRQLARRLLHTRQGENARHGGCGSIWLFSRRSAQFAAVGLDRHFGAWLRRLFERRHPGRRVVGFDRPVAPPASTGRGRRLLRHAAAVYGSELQKWRPLYRRVESLLLRLQCCILLRRSLFHSPFPIFETSHHRMQICSECPLGCEIARKLLALGRSISYWSTPFQLQYDRLYVGSAEVDAVADQREKMFYNENDHHFHGEMADFQFNGLQVLTLAWHGQIGHSGGSGAGSGLWAVGDVRSTNVLYSAERDFVVSFQADSFAKVSLEKPTTVTLDKLEVSFTFRTTEKNGVLLYRQGDSRNFLLVELFNGRLICRFNSTDYKHALQSNHPLPLNDHNWHHVAFYDSAQHTGEIRLVVDNYTSNWSSDSVRPRPVRYNASLVIGYPGVEVADRLVDVLPSGRGFQGCMVNLKIDGSPVRLLQDSEMQANLRRGCTKMCPRELCIGKDGCPLEKVPADCDCLLTEISDLYCLNHQYGESVLSEKSIQLNDGQYHFVQFNRSRLDLTLQIDQQERVVTKMKGQASTTTASWMKHTDRWIALGGRFDGQVQTKRRQFRRGSSLPFNDAFYGILSSVLVNDYRLLELASAGDERVILVGDVRRHHYFNHNESQLNHLEHQQLETTMPNEETTTTAATFFDSTNPMKLNHHRRAAAAAVLANDSNSKLSPSQITRRRRSTFQDLRIQRLKVPLSNL
ncbi:putative laminin G domain protein [Trichinella spiralis]|uniref:putative laminin G domain protein n=1 Tax=Trichinella spiralis TaxID=6334 RepID=UPI0001EFBFAD|nr:putative laminin G domain protein [Trichinella spiralis]